MQTFGIQKLFLEAVAQANPNTVVVLIGGGAMELPWESKVKAILYMGLPGQAGGQAVANLLTGKVNPSGKLTETWPVSYDDVICKETFGVRNPEYWEGIYVGYRFYDKAGKTVRYSYGHGLSYTHFEYSNLQIKDRTVTVQVKNTGAVNGAEIIQLYIAPAQDGLHRPRREPKGFDRVELMPGEDKEVRFDLNERSFALWADGWTIPNGTYKIQIGASSRDIRLEQEVVITGDTVSGPVWQIGSWYETLSGSPPTGRMGKANGSPRPNCGRTSKGAVYYG